jgi:hypothetical protein
VKVSVESLMEQSGKKVDVVESKIPELKNKIHETKMELDESTKAEVMKPIKKQWRVFLISKLK